MKALLLVLMLAVSSPLFAAAAPVQPECVGVIVYSVDGKIRDLIFVFSNGGILDADPADCVAAPACKAEVEHLVAIKHVKLVDVSTGTKI